jgi:peptidoglycan/LPS O-acetylase OafA/YrhL
MNLVQGIVHNNFTNFHYRSDIDGLRAIAIIAVILYHAGFKAFGGGFIGVDIFFVISGYLITALILKDKENGNFSLTNFYERRARRILPALFFVMLACLPIAWFYMNPMELKSFGQSLITVPIFVSNILFSRTLGYFDQAINNNMLLHTWSLGVEEQCYVLFPIFIVIFWSYGHKKIVKITFITALLSLTCCQLALRNYPEANFYQTSTRAWEFLVGSLLAFSPLNVTIYSRLAEVVNNLLGFLGLALILFAIFIYNNTTPYPSMYTLVPVLGTAFIIAFAQQDTIVGKILSLKPLAGIGLISYSAYLWHQPVFVFARIYGHKTELFYQFSMVALVTTILAYLTWKYVEAPVRDQSKFSRRHIIILYSICSISFISLGAVLFLSHGLLYTLKPHQRELIMFSANYEKDLAYKEHPCFLGENANFSELETCMSSSSGSANQIILWGDSHAAHLFPGLKQQLATNEILTELTASACPPLLGFDAPNRPHCRKMNDYIFAKISRELPRRVILAAAWWAYDWKKLEKTIVQLRGLGIQNIELVGPVPRWKKGLPVILADLDMSFVDLPKRKNSGVNPSVFLLNKKMENFAQHHNIKYISPLAILCNAEGCITRLGDTTASLTTWDCSHLTVKGSIFLTSHFYDMR